MNLEKKYLKYKTKYLELYKSSVYAICVLKSGCKTILNCINKNTIK